MKCVQCLQQFNATARSPARSLEQYDGNFPANLYTLGGALPVYCLNWAAQTVIGAARHLCDAIAFV